MVEVRRLLAPGKEETEFLRTSTQWAARVSNPARRIKRLTGHVLTGPAQAH
jgi:hypothetical protein